MYRADEGNMNLSKIYLMQMCKPRPEPPYLRVVELSAVCHDCISTKTTELMGRKQLPTIDKSLCLL